MIIQHDTQPFAGRARKIEAKRAIENNRRTEIDANKINARKTRYTATGDRQEGEEQTVQSVDRIEGRKEKEREREREREKTQRP